ncbi:MAG: hypothetical protein ACNI3C_10815 [Candidatus Marinarcus sp.]|uniref:hypothetical protein n=1 Tax=Candidatus Marinarcus sp. TaxID=3100987 RepID=UPI003AFF6D66
MKNIALILFIAAELCYYLLIAQTGVVEYFASDLFKIGFLPVGGVVGCILSTYLPLPHKLKINIFLFLQLLLTFFYPDFNAVTLFSLGLCVGALAPLIIDTLKYSNKLQLGLSLAISYTIGTLLFNYTPANREYIGIFLSFIAFTSSLFLNNQESKNKKHFIKEFSSGGLLIMILWVFLDSALFETLSRDITIPIWRGGFSFEIILFHILGVIAAIAYKIENNQKDLLIITLFALSYFFYFLREPILLSIVYPFVISYYNVVILQNLIKIKSIKRIGVYMVFIGWIASGGGLIVALEELTIFIPLIFLIVLLRVITIQNTKKESYYV